MKEPRKPAAFRLDPPSAAEPAAEAPRQPRAMRGPDLAEVVAAEIDAFEAEGTPAADGPPPPPPPGRRSRAVALLVAALGILLSLAVGLWVDGLIRDLSARADWLGWLAAGVAAVGFVALVLVLWRELAGLMRLRSVERLQSAGRDAAMADDARAARAVVAELKQLFAARPETAAARRSLDALDGEIVDGRDLIRLAEAELLVPIDVRARTLILDAAKRVSVVTAVSPRALVDVAYILFESGRLIRRIAELYGGRPGMLGFLRLARGVLAHLAVTGMMAAGDEFVHQIVGQGLAARLSAKLGEGVVNGMMTARIGLAAMETARPLPYLAARRPGLSDFLPALTRFASNNPVRNGKVQK